MLKIPKHLDLQEGYEVQHLNLEEDSSKHFSFSPNMFSCAKAEFPLAVVLVLSVARYFTII